MLQVYNSLRHLYIIDGYESAYAYLAELDSSFDSGVALGDCEEESQQEELSEILMTNLYCYLSIQSEFRSEDVLKILEECLAKLAEIEKKLKARAPKLTRKFSSDRPLSPTSPATGNFSKNSSQPSTVGAVDGLSCSSLIALTLYHISSIHFKRGGSDGYCGCLDSCMKLVQSFLPQYYMLEKRLQRDPEQEIKMNDLQEILYYSFLMAAYCCRKQKDASKAKTYLEAGRRIIKDRADVLSLTGASILSVNPTNNLPLLTPIKKQLHSELMESDAKIMQKGGKSTIESEGCVSQLLENRSFRQEKLGKQ